MGLQSLNGYGIDEEAPFPQIETDNNVEIPESRIKLCNFQCRCCMPISILCSTMEMTESDYT